MKETNKQSKEQSGEQNKETIIILHGLFDNKHRFKILKEFLEKIGYEVYIFNYPTVFLQVKEIVLEHFIPQLNKIGKSEYIFVTHSMGSLILRYWYKFENHENVKITKAILLAPPSKGSPLADYYHILPDNLKYPMKELSTSSNSFVYSLGFCNFKHGILVGASSNRIAFFNAHFNDNTMHDGMVRVYDTLTPDYDDFFLIEELEHDSVAFSQIALDCIANYLKYGKFQIIQKAN